MRTITISSSNHVESTDSQYTYNFPSTVKFNDGDAIGVSSTALYSSTLSITSSRGSSTLTTSWSADTTTTFSITIPDGYYSVENLNFFLQQQCTLNNLYVTSSSGESVYFLELTINPTRYAVSLSAYPIPTSAQATTLGYTQPAGATWTYPATAQCPQVTFNSEFGALVGYTAGSYPSTSSESTTQNFISDLTPSISVVDSYTMTCSLTNSPYSTPSDAFFSVPLTAGLGELVSVSPSQTVLNNIAPSSYQQIKISFFDQNFRPLEVSDNQLTLTLAVLNKNERSI